jgi:hypothetical protein
LWKRFLKNKEWYMEKLDISPVVRWESLQALSCLIELM